MNEEKYKEILNKAVRLAHEGNNRISEEDYVKLFSPLKMSGEHDSLTRNYLKELHIVIGSRDEEADIDFDMKEISSEDGRYLSNYLEELDSLPVYSEDEIRIIYEDALSNDSEEARKKLINLHLRNVVDIAKLYVYHGMSIEDLIGEGNIGLMMAVDLLGTVDSREEAEGLIGKTIMDAMDAAINEDRALKGDIDEMLDSINRVTEEAEKLSGDIKRDVSVKELAENTDLTEEEILRAHELTGYKISGLEKTEG